MDRAVSPHLAPFRPLPQARPSRSLQGRPACCGSATCELCPVDARFSPLNGLRAVLEHPRLKLHQQTVAARLRPQRTGRSIEALEALGASGERVLVRAPRYVLATSGFENPAILLRSDLRRAAVGRYLFDHGHTTITVSLRRDLKPGHGYSLSTGLSEAFREGDFRSRRSAAIVSPFNPGAALAPLVAAGVIDREDGDSVRARALAQWRGLLPLDVLTEDVPQPERRVTLASGRDSFGLPLNSVAYPASTRYELDGIERVAARGRGGGWRRSASAASKRRPGRAAGTCSAPVGWRLPARTASSTQQMRHLDFENLFVAGGSASPPTARSTRR